MENIIEIAVPRDAKSRMVRQVSLELNKALSTVAPPFNDKRDILKLGTMSCESKELKVTYEILRDARPSRAEENRSPYREKGMIMNVSGNH